MGGKLSKKSKDFSILMSGAPSSGKSLLVQRLSTYIGSNNDNINLKEIQAPSRTEGLDKTDICSNKVNMRFWDIGGAESVSVHSFSFPINSLRCLTPILASLSPTGGL